MLNFNCVILRRALNKCVLPREYGRYISGQCGRIGSSPPRLICQDYTLQLHKTAEPPQTSKTCPYVDKNGCVLSPLSLPPTPPLPTKSIYRDWIDRLLPVEPPLSLSKIRGLAGQRHISFMFLRLYRPVIYRARANIQLKEEGSGFFMGGWKAG